MSSENIVEGNLVWELQTGGENKIIWSCDSLQWSIKVGGTEYAFVPSVNEGGYKELRFVESRRYVNIHTGEQSTHALTEAQLDENTFLSAEDKDNMPTIDRLTVDVPSELEVGQGDFVTKLIKQRFPDAFPNANLAIISSSWMSRQATANDQNIHLVHIGDRVAFHPDQPGKVQVLRPGSNDPVVDWVEIYPYYLHEQK